MNWMTLLGESLSMNDETRSQLVTAALEVQQKAYAKYSNFWVGAALLTESGKIIAGCNVENASYGLTICAERSAVFTAVGMGETSFKAIAIATAGGYPPCGACRQVLAEFCGSLPVILVNSDDPADQQMHDLAQLLPGRFVLE